MPKTMSHTPEQRKDWHDGKACRAFVTTCSTKTKFIRALKKGNFRGAATPVNARIQYAPLKRGQTV